MSGRKGIRKPILHCLPPMTARRLLSGFLPYIPKGSKLLGNFGDACDSC